MPRKLVVEILIPDEWSNIGEVKISEDTITDCLSTLPPWGGAERPTVKIVSDTEVYGEIPTEESCDTCGSIKRMSESPCCAE